MARYDLEQAYFHTPKGKSVLVYVRSGTNDFNTANSCLTADEYGTAGLEFSGPFLDIGGYIGTVSLAVLLDHPGTRAIIVEPIPENVALIRYNLAVNQVGQRAKVITGAVGSGEVVIHYAFTDTENDLHHAFVGNANGVPQGAREHRTVKYQGLAYRDLVEDDVAFVKIDCEGGEWAVLPEMIRVPRIVGEIHPVNLANGEVGSRARLEAILGATHSITYAGPEGSPEAWGFTAIRQ